MIPSGHRRSAALPVRPGGQRPEIAAAVLAAREARAERQRSLLAPPHVTAVVSATLVVPGPQKCPPWTVPVWAEMVAVVRRTIALRGWPVAAEDIRAGGVGGDEALWALTAAPEVVKRALVDVEDSHPCGRLWDLDVLTLQEGIARPLSRGGWGSLPRRCLVCGEAAAACARSGAHAHSDVAAACRRIVTGWELAEASPYASSAYQALVTEVWHTPKPGLVDRMSCGAHPDMDVSLFEVSAASVVSGFTACEQVGRSVGRRGKSPVTMMPQLRRVGIAAEARMYDATGGVNTHKGAIYALGLLTAAAGWVASASPAVVAAVTGISDHDPVSVVCAVVSVMVRGESSSPPLTELDTHGARARATYGMGGAPAEAARGFDSVRRGSLPAYRRVLAAGGDVDSALSEALLVLLASNDDTCLAARGGLVAVQSVREWAAGMLAAGGAAARDFAEHAERYDVELSARGWSPGGCADLLGVTVFLASLTPVAPETSLLVSQRSDIYESFSPAIDLDSAIEASAWP
ncbi:2-(5''-triphosphoribosyl)-3'-dephosphocoenzyme-A synthase [Austwickia sp. TVS 96-490-7B]|uniref:citrate lyase holo-[acyl-carrier protein] synthase n=1 Tax=Austwickia sp. TVS 96-490-7B TaxID=2830843 RepID=UPI001C55AA8E|nr:citrate lyase holo-[acyl-carrier protein] synthase [Austwickia sp. TVS 96-490-7B]MBW3085017.1 2-(5''-triphosphoribosyl)-3'-dephosphocoenzyme-A synthase [Austwickia sp. TVS 96-490-7B]